MTNRTRRRTLTAAIVAPLGLTLGTPASRADEAMGDGSGEAEQAARAWFASLAGARLDPRTHPGIVLVLHGFGAGLDGTPEYFEGREAVAAVLAGTGPARWEVEDVLAGNGCAALRGTALFPDGRAATFAAFVTLRGGRVVRVERHMDRILRQAPGV